MFRKFLPIIIIALIILAVFLFYYFTSTPSDVPISNWSISEKKELPCVEDETKTCFSGSCNGYQVCKNSEWSRCIIKRICNPNSRENCVENGCSVGYKLCNECGTGYEECVST